ncbi:VOC family protein [Actinotalea caeni]|uniref:VOC family protein n=1 Tax=Actinotalea caeni TaxID=1348467 RepID=UPI0012E1A84D|nr:VOC family protein [Actinotalea caeni]
MTSRISHTSIDCRNAYELSEWWRQLLDYVDVADDPNEPGHEECMILARDGSHHVLFIEVPEAKTVKNRLHFDLRPTDRTQQEEVDRLVGVGATVLADCRGQYGPGTGWVTMADPEGNEFCVLRGDGELAATPG